MSNPITKVLSLEDDGLGTFYRCELADGTIEGYHNPLISGCSPDVWKDYTSRMLDRMIADPRSGARVRAMFHIRDQYHPEEY